MPFLNSLLLEKMNRNKNKMFKKPSIRKNFKRQGLQSQVPDCLLHGPKNPQWGWQPQPGLQAWRPAPLWHKDEFWSAGAWPWEGEALQHKIFCQTGSQKPGSPPALNKSHLSPGMLNGSHRPGSSGPFTQVPCLHASRGGHGGRGGMPPRCQQGLHGHWNYRWPSALYCSILVRFSTVAVYLKHQNKLPVFKKKKKKRQGLLLLETLLRCCHVTNYPPGSAHWVSHSQSINPENTQCESAL